MTEQLTKKMATVFSLAAPGARTVMLVGDFTDWQKHPIALEQQLDGRWEATVVLSLGYHRYRFLVDGKWRDDPLCPVRAANAFGSQDSVVKVCPIRGLF
jgi:1,4-alpha-glucan branching enzyme